MDRIKRARRPERAAVTRVIATIESLFLHVPINRIEVEASLQDLDRHLHKLVDLDDSMKNALLDSDNTTDEEMDRECQAMEDYQVKATLVKVRANSLLTIALPTGSPTHSVTSNIVSITKRNFKLPKIELRKFSGELSEWLGWWAQFAKIDEDEALHDSDKFTYLLQSMTEGSRAHDLVTSYPQSKENYPKVVTALRERYGNPKLLKQVYIRELIHMITNRKKENKLLSTLYDQLESHLRSLESLGVSVEQMTIFLFPMVESCLTEDILMAWQRSPNYGKDGSTLTPPKNELDFLMAFLKQEIYNEEQRKLAQSGFGSSTEKKKTIRRKESVEEGEFCPTAAGLFSATIGKLSCLFCDKYHESKECYKAQKMTLEEKKGKVQKKGACFACLKTGHISKKCKSHVKCPVCGKKHVVLLCPEIPTNNPTLSSQGPPDNVSTVQAHLNCTSEVILRTMMVRVMNPITLKIKTLRILLDCGSQRSYLLRKTAEDLGLVPVNTVTLNHSLFGGSRVANQNHNEFQVCVLSTQGSKSFKLTVLEQNRICEVVPRAMKGPWMMELQRRKIFVSDLDSKSSTEVEMLIGADYLGDFLTGKIFRLDNGLTATETVFGWTLMGRVQRYERQETLAMTVIGMSVTSTSVAELWKLDVCWTSCRSSNS